MTPRLKYYIWFGRRWLVHRPVLAVLLVLIIFYFAAATVVAVYEGVGFGDAFLKIFPSFLGEVGEIESPFIAVKLSVVIGMLISFLFLAVIIGKFSSILWEKIRRGGIMDKKVNLSDHTIICGWNYQGPRIVKELLNADIARQRGIVIVTESNERPYNDARVGFIDGDPSQDVNLQRASIREARSVIVLTDFDKDKNVADAEALMVTLAAEKMNRQVYTCVQLRNSDNRFHLEHANADDIICLDQMGGSIAVASALNPGISHVLCDLLTFNTGSEFYRYDKGLSERLVNKEFSEAVQLLAEQRMILIGIETDCSEELKTQLSADVIIELAQESQQDKRRAIVVNPQSKYTLRQNDALFVIAEREPTHL